MLSVGITELTDENAAGQRGIALICDETDNPSVTDRLSDPNPLLAEGVLDVVPIVARLRVRNNKREITSLCFWGPRRWNT